MASVLKLCEDFVGSLHDKFGALEEDVGVVFDELDLGAVGGCDDGDGSAVFAFVFDKCDGTEVEDLFVNSDEI
jgi:hypothetical protein